MTELKIKCPECDDGSIQGVDCSNCEGKGSIPVEILSAEKILEEGNYVLGYPKIKSYDKKKFISLSQVQEIIELNRKELLDEVEKIIDKNTTGSEKFIDLSPDDFKKQLKRLEK